MEILIVYALFMGMPLAALAFFIISLVRFIKRDKNDMEQRRSRKISLIVSSVILVTVIAVWITMIILMSLELQHM